MASWCSGDWDIQQSRLLLLLAGDAHQQALDLFLPGCPTKATKTAKKYSNGCNTNQRNDNDGHHQLPGTAIPTRPQTAQWKTDRIRIG